MSELITITTVTANTPVNIYYCDALSASCVLAASSVVAFPYTFTVPSPVSDTSFVIKIEDYYGFQVGYTIPITPQPTPNNTPTPTITQSVTPTITTSPTTTPTLTITNTSSPHVTPTFTPTVTTTPYVVYHQIGQSVNCNSSTSCYDILSQNYLYNYISDATSVPVVGITIYSTQNNSILYNPYNGDDQWILMSWTSGNYSVQISSLGIILDFVSC